MHAEIISIGDELTSGQRLDTNSQWLSTRLGELGVTMMYHTTVADNLEANVQVFQQAAERADLVIATGGLGPTADDLTREVIAAVAGVELDFLPSVFAHIENMFARRKRPMPERNRVQAMFPRGSRVIPNPAGTAPGIDIDIPRQENGPRVFLHCPACRPRCSKCGSKPWPRPLPTCSAAPQVIRHKQIKCFGVGESDLEAMLPDLIRRGRDPQVGITVSGATITLRITAAGATADECYRKMEPTIDTIHRMPGRFGFRRGN